MAERTYIIQLLPTQTGASITIDLYDYSAQLVEADISAQIDELGSGEYVWRRDIDAGWSGYAVVKASGVYQTTLPINEPAAVNLSPIQTALSSLQSAVAAIDTELDGLSVDVDLQPILDAVSDLETQVAALQASLNAAEVTVVSPFSANSTDLTIRRGDAYVAALGSALSWSSEGWPDLSTATGVVFSIKGRWTGDTPISAKAATIVTSGADTQTVRLELSSDETTALAVGDRVYIYDIQATFAAGRVTIVTGDLTVTEDVTRP